MITKDNPYSDDIFDLILNNEDNSQNKRRSVRYIRNDIQVRICTRNLFGFRKIMPGKLKDISSQGVLIYTVQKLKIGKRVVLKLRFKDGKIFSINALLVRKQVKNKAVYIYGFKFDKQENELADYLLMTQTDLAFS